MFINIHACVHLFTFVNVRVYVYADVSQCDIKSICAHMSVHVSANGVDEQTCL